MFSRLRGVMRKLQERLLYAELTRESLEEVCDELLLELVESDVAYEAAEAILNELVERLVGVRAPRGEGRRGLVREKLREVLTEILTPERISLAEVVRSRRDGGRPCVLLFLGPNGHGKTTTVAKVAVWLMGRGFRPVLAAADTFRAGAIEQLEAHARKIGVKVVKHGYGADPAAVAFDAVRYAEGRGMDAVLIDTAGRLQTDVNLMEEMRKIARVVKPDLKIFVGDALTGNDALEQARKFHEYVGIDASILTKVDADAKGGAAISIVYATGKPLLFLGTGQGYGDLVEFSPEWIIDRVLPP